MSSNFGANDVLLSLRDSCVTAERVAAHNTVLGTSKFYLIYPLLN
jgi:hypothetical protein